MNIRHLFYTITALSIVWATRCSQSPSQRVPSNYMGFDKVSYVDKFPQTFSLQGRVEPEIDVIGIQSFAVYDSLVIFSTNNGRALWSFVSLPDYRDLGSFLTRGEGPFEFVQAPSVSNGAQFAVKGNNLVAQIYDFQRGRLLEMNMTRSITSQELEMAILHDSLPKYSFNFLVINDDTYFCKATNNHHTQQNRYLLNKNNERTVPAIFEKLNQIVLREGEDLNLLSTSTKWHAQYDRLVEMPTGLNYINLYAPDGSFAKTICVGTELDDLDKIQDQRAWNRIYRFANLRVFDDFFGVVQINEDEMTYQTKRKKLPAILLFDWNGEPLAELKLDHFITSFDIDFINGVLYTFDVHSDEFFKYDINDILLKIK
ncbi:MAG TPA: BF3164 family lipoprotein [Sphingobacteriaceae bacterium]|nr:BF3164 family lipoprotein [Sphingobacteriaceae bacterium]